MSRSDQSQFYIPCLCGAEVRSHEREARCSACGRWLKVEWGQNTERTESDASERRAVYGIAQQ
jgi:hypothetical protein